MKRLALFLASLFFAAAASWAAPAIWDIDITLGLRPDGSAAVTEVWNVSVASGTEWYLVRDNLGRIQISDLTVSDETGLRYTNVGDWDTDRSLDEKAGQCGIVRKRDGCELCWGVGSYGEHIYTVSYLMSGVIDGYSDYDAFHFQIVTPELSSSPQHVKVTVRSDAAPFSTINARFWAFGFQGTTAFQDGALVAESTRSLKRSESVILLIQLNKGLFATSSESTDAFETHLQEAMEGASYEDDEQESSFLEKIAALFISVISFLGWIVFPLIALLGSKLRSRKKILGCKLSEVSWCRDIPCQGDILEADYILGQLGEDKQKNTIAGAMILRMIKNGNLRVNKDAKDRIEISFDDSRSQDNLSQSERSLYTMLQAASGSDVILQHNEFSRWSARHSSRVNRWVEQVTAEGKTHMGDNGYLRSGRFTERGQEEARKVVGFKKYLSDFTIIGERASQEVELWHDYLVFAALYGIADQVAKELKDINPKAFEQMMVYDYNTMNDVVHLTRAMANSITSARAQHLSSGSFSPSRGGFGGFTSIGGGGGFHGGGFGGGSR